MADNLEILMWRLTRLEAELTNVEKQVEALKAEIAVRDKGQLKAGVIFLGGLIFTLVGVIWANLGLIMPGR
jgi:hypothetical protein